MSCRMILEYINFENYFEGEGAAFEIIESSISGHPVTIRPGQD